MDGDVASQGPNSVTKCPHVDVSRNRRGIERLLGIGGIETDPRIADLHLHEMAWAVRLDGDFKHALHRNRFRGIAKQIRDDRFKKGAFDRNPDRRFRHLHQGGQAGPIARAARFGHDMPGETREIDTVLHLRFPARTDRRIARRSSSPRAPGCLRGWRCRLAVRTNPQSLGRDSDEECAILGPAMDRNRSMRRNLKRKCRLEIGDLTK